MDRERNFHQQRPSGNQQYYGAYNRPQYDFGRSQHSINFITEDFLAGFQEDGRMSVVRRFFCLFVTFDVIFISLLWIISVVITGENIYDALRKQVLHYSIYTSLFDVIAAAIFRFCILILFYGLCSINHWTIVALCTSGSCGFLVAKVFYYDWAQTPQPLFQVLLIIISFVLSWGEAWFLDCRVIPQERHARNYFIAATSSLPDRQQFNERSPLLVPFLNSTQYYSAAAPESIGNFYSPIDSGENSDDDVVDLTEDYKKIGVEAVKRAFDLLESKEWKIEKVTSANDTIKSLHRDGLGKIYRLTARIPCEATVLLNNLFYRIEDVPNWNPTLLESKILETIDSHTDITYQATIGGGGGMVKCRDFVNLRCWQLLRDGKIIKNYEIPSVKLKGDIAHNVMSKSLPTQELQKKLSALTESEAERTIEVFSQNEQISSSLGASIVFSDNKEDGENKFTDSNSDIATLSKSLGAKHFNETDHNLSDDEIGFLDAKESESPPENLHSLPESPPTRCCDSELLISAAVSVTHSGAPPTEKYIRGENLVSCWAMRHIPQQTDWCIFEWLLCLDLKGYIPRYVLDSAYSTLMQDYMKYLRQHCNTINSLSKCPKCNKTDYDKKCLCSKSS